MPQPDYENDLVFPPQEIKSQHELSDQGRQSDVLIKAIEECEKLEKENRQLRSAIMCIEVETASAGGTNNEMLRSLLNIDDICKGVLEEELDK
jgi:hypothetical protein